MDIILSELVYLEEKINELTKFLRQKVVLMVDDYFTILFAILLEK